MAQQAKLKDYDVRVMPKPKNLIEKLLSDLGAADEDDTSTISMSLGSAGAKRSSALLEAALPYLEGLDPYRVKAVKTALKQLGLFDEERVILAMPVIHIRD